jgi:hypothetical protein
MSVKGAGGSSFCSTAPSFVRFAGSAFNSAPTHRANPVHATESGSISSSFSDNHRLVPLRKRHKANSELSCFQPADSRFRRKRCLRPGRVNWICTSSPGLSGTNGLIDQQKRLLNSDAKLGDLSVSAINDYRDRSERISELSQELETTLSSQDAADPVSPPERKAC